MVIIAENRVTTKFWALIHWFRPVQAHQSDLKYKLGDISLASDPRGHWSGANMVQTGMLAGIADGEGFVSQAISVMTGNANAMGASYRSPCEPQLNGQPGHIVSPLRGQLGSLSDF